MKIYQLATDLNLASETLIGVLRKKGFDVKSHMADVTDEMMAAANSHFKKERDVAVLHQRKLEEFGSSTKKERTDSATEKKENQIKKS